MIFVVLSSFFLEFIFPQTQSSFLMLFSRLVTLKCSCAYESMVDLLKLQLWSRRSEWGPRSWFSVMFLEEPNAAPWRTTLWKVKSETFTCVLILISVYSENYQSYLYPRSFSWVPYLCLPGFSNQMSFSISKTKWKSLSSQPSKVL